jgi:hypothetical protein
MSGVIAFGKTAERVWLVAGWAFRRFLADLKSALPQDEKHSFLIDQAEAMHGLHFELIQPEDPLLAGELLRAVRKVAEDTLSGDSKTVQAWREGLDSDGRAMYLSAMRDLLSSMGEGLAPPSIVPESPPSLDP